MDRSKCSAIAHRTHRFCSPMAEAPLDEVLSALTLPPGARVVDFGCGNAEMLLHMMARFQASASSAQRP